MYRSCLREQPSCGGMRVTLRADDGGRQRRARVRVEVTAGIQTACDAPAAKTRVTMTTRGGRCAQRARSERAGGEQPRQFRLESGESGPGVGEGAARGGADGLKHAHTDPDASAELSAKLCAHGAGESRQAGRVAREDLVDRHRRRTVARRLPLEGAQHQVPSTKSGRSSRTAHRNSSGVWTSIPRGSHARRRKCRTFQVTMTSAPPATAAACMTPSMRSMRAASNPGTDRKTARRISSTISADHKGRKARVCATLRSVSRRPIGYSTQASRTAVRNLQNSSPSACDS